MHFTRQITRYTSLNSSERNVTELGESAANATPTETQWHRNDMALELPHERASLDTLETVAVALRRTVE